MRKLRRFALPMVAGSCLIVGLVGCSVSGGGGDGPEKGNGSRLEVAQIDSPNGPLVCVYSAYSNESGIWCEDLKE